METALVLLTIQGVLGGLDNLWHHEITEGLPRNPNARHELALHSVREFLYAVIFLTIAWATWDGAWAFVLLAIMGIEIAVTLWDFLIEDRTRKLPPLERVLHTVLAINFGAFLAFFVPAVLLWAERPSGFGSASYGLYSWVLTGYGIGVLLWSIRDTVATWRLFIPEWQRKPFIVRPSAKAETFLVTGGTGFIGRDVVSRLIERGDRVIVLTRNPALVRHMFGPYAEAVSDLAEIDTGERIDGIVNLAGAPVIGMPWTAARRRVLLESRVGTTAAIGATVAGLRRKPRVLVSGSAIGFYGLRDDEVLDETAWPQDVFMSRLCQAWERATERVAGEGVRVCRMRMGLVFGRGGGPLAGFALPAMFGLGAVFGDGRQWVSWIHKDDLVNLLLLALADERFVGAVNATAPEPLRQAEFTDVLCGVLRRRHFLRVPAWALRFGLGEQAGLFVAGQRVVPAKALAAGFAFAYPGCREALAELLAAKGDVAMSGTDRIYPLRTWGSKPL